MTQLHLRILQQKATRIVAGARKGVGIYQFKEVEDFKSFEEKIQNENSKQQPEKS